MSNQESNSTLISLVLTGRGDIVSATSNGQKMSTVEGSVDDSSDDRPNELDKDRDRWEMSVSIGDDDDVRVAWSSSASRSMNFQIRRLSEEPGQGPDTDRDRWELNFDIGPAQLEGAGEGPSPKAIAAGGNGSVHPDLTEGEHLNSP